MARGPKLKFQDPFTARGSKVKIEEQTSV